MCLRVHENGTNVSFFLNGLSWWWGEGNWRGGGTAASPSTVCSRKESCGNKVHHQSKYEKSGISQLHVLGENSPIFSENLRVTQEPVQNLQAQKENKWTTKKFSPKILLPMIFPINYSGGLGYSLDDFGGLRCGCGDGSGCISYGGFSGAAAVPQ